MTEFDANSSRINTSLECNLCFQRYRHESRPCVLLCARGHSSCGPCGKLLRQCPVCRDPLLVPGGILNRALMDLIPVDEDSAERPQPSVHSASAGSVPCNGFDTLSSSCTRGHQLMQYSREQYMGSARLICSDCLSHDIQLRDTFYQCSDCGTAVCLRCFNNTPAALIEHPPAVPCSHRMHLQKKDVGVEFDKICNICFLFFNGPHIYCSGCNNFAMCHDCSRSTCLNRHPLVQEFISSSNTTCSLCRNQKNSIGSSVSASCARCKYVLCPTCAFN